jgi:DNA primase
VDGKKAGSNYKGISYFFTNDRLPFMVSPSKAEYLNVFYSGKGGGLVKVCHKKRNDELPEAIRHLCKTFNIECLESEETTKKKFLPRERVNAHYK